MSRKRRRYSRKNQRCHARVSPFWRAYDHLALQKLCQGHHLRWQGIAEFVEEHGRHPVAEDWWALPPWEMPWLTRGPWRKGPFHPHLVAWDDIPF
jgi:hypothetical protein